MSLNEGKNIQFIFEGSIEEYIWQIEAEVTRIEQVYGIKDKELEIEKLIFKIALRNLPVKIKELVVATIDRIEVKLENNEVIQWLKPKHNKKIHKLIEILKRKRFQIADIIDRSG